MKQKPETKKFAQNFQTVFGIAVAFPIQMVIVRTLCCWYSPQTDGSGHCRCMPHGKFTRRYAKFINAILKMKSCYRSGPQCGARLRCSCRVWFEPKSKKKKTFTLTRIQIEHIEFVDVVVVAVSCRSRCRRRRRCRFAFFFFFLALFAYDVRPSLYSQQTLLNNKTRVWHTKFYTQQSEMREKKSRFSHRSDPHATRLLLLLSYN